MVLPVPIEVAVTLSTVAANFGTEPVQRLSSGIHHEQSTTLTTLAKELSLLWLAIVYTLYGLSVQASLSETVSKRASFL